MSKPRVDVGQRIWRFVRRDASGCWLWTGAKYSTGYGQVRVYVGEVSRLRPAHRVMFELQRGPIADGLQLDHLCRNIACVNPEHLEPVTPRENLMRGRGVTAENARKTHCRRGHEFTERNTRTTPEGRRACRRCAVIACQERRARLAARGLTTRDRLS